MSRACTAETEVEVMAATQKIDVFTLPDPACAAERAHMGLLGELAEIRGSRANSEEGHC